MSDQSRWWSLPINEFFTQGNWSGQAFNQQLNPHNQAAKLSENWQLSSVKTFFANCPWFGEITVIDTATLLEPSACLTTSVREFFGLIPWGEGMAIPSPIKSSNPQIEFPPIVSKSNTLDDLAQLF
ncbi:hypothetical protein [Merismopedia glauca]|uniref:Uncharacterized protein n=1 Tax=Merismopedia glauca CCAP 1448/3 TaxID=1296344 RepID=A0A2T1BXU7_9CYAN|nr:hypothetical protein [Merismopedia glauca]PSB00737.1 hypothetical protein C7B64_21975 [Merismopedia glauca CCAP 1448/3]